MEIGEWIRRSDLGLTDEPDEGDGEFGGGEEPALAVSDVFATGFTVVVVGGCPGGSESEFGFDAEVVGDNPMVTVTDADGYEVALVAVVVEVTGKGDIELVAQTSDVVVHIGGMDAKEVPIERRAEPVAVLGLHEDVTPLHVGLGVHSPRVVREPDGKGVTGGKAHFRLGLNEAVAQPGMSVFSATY